jgi:hypothetical protein
MRVKTGQEKVSMVGQKRQKPLRIGKYDRRSGFTLRAVGEEVGDTLFQTLSLPQNTFIEMEMSRKLRF